MRAGQPLTMPGVLRLNRDPLALGIAIGWGCPAAHKSLTCLLLRDAQRWSWPPCMALPRYLTASLRPSMTDDG